MTIGTSDFFLVMRTAMPAETQVILVTCSTEFILFKDRYNAVDSKCCDRRPIGTAPYPTRMLATGTVAGFALQLVVSEWRARILTYRMLAPKHGECRLIVVAGETGISTLATVRGLAIVRLRQYDGRDT